MGSRRGDRICHEKSGDDATLQDDSSVHDNLLNVGEARKMMRQ